MDPDRLRIAVQKTGRLVDESLALLRGAGLAISRSKDGLYYRAENLPVDVLLVRDDDIPRLVGDGVAELGIVGSNVVEESRASNGDRPGVEQLLPLGFAKCHLSVAAPEGKRLSRPDDLSGLRIATSYPGLLREYLAKSGLSAKIVKMEGSVEVAPRLGVAEAICDLVSTGATLEANSLTEIDRLIDCEALLIGTQQQIPTAKRELADRLLSRLKGVLASVETKYIMLNAPVASLSEVKALLPGADAPTVIPLDGRDDRVAVHAVCKESVFWETMERLKAAGASAILVVPIEKMLI